MNLLMSFFLAIYDSISKPVDIARSSIANMFSGSASATLILLLSNPNGINIYLLHKF